VRRIGVMPYNVDDAQGRNLFRRSKRGLLDLGWTEGRNIEINYRWIGEDISRRVVYAAELVAASPDVLLQISRETRRRIANSRRLISDGARKIVS
jgi:putative ABC transport system substrate-binding protein